MMWQWVEKKQPCPPREPWEQGRFKGQKGWRPEYPKDWPWVVEFGLERVYREGWPV